jgi:hypothetical protein
MNKRVGTQDGSYKGGVGQEVKHVFLDQFGCFASLVAAVFAAGHLKEEAHYRQLLSIPDFAEPHPYHPGELQLRARDEQGNEYYTLSAGVYGCFVKTVLGPEILRLLGTQKQMLIYDLSSINPWSLCILEMLTRGRFRKYIKTIWAKYLSARMPSLVRRIKQQNCL